MRSKKKNKLLAENQQLRRENMQLRHEKASLMLTKQKDCNSLKRELRAKDKQISALNQKIQWAILVVRHITELVTHNYYPRTYCIDFILRAKNIIDELKTSSSSSISEAEQNSKLKHAFAK